MAAAASDPSPPPDNQILITREATFKKYNDKPHAGTQKDSVTQVPNRDVSAWSPLLSCFPQASLSCQPQQFAFAWPIFPYCPCLFPQTQKKQPVELAFGIWSRRQRLSQVQRQFVIFGVVPWLLTTGRAVLWMLTTLRSTVL